MSKTGYDQEQEQLDSAIKSNIDNLTHKAKGKPLTEEQLERVVHTISTDSGFTECEVHRHLSHYIKRYNIRFAA